MNHLHTPTSTATHTPTQASPLPPVANDINYEQIREEVQSMFRKVGKDPVNQALYKAVLEYRLENAR